MSAPDLASEQSLQPLLRPLFVALGGDLRALRTKTPVPLKVDAFFPPPYNFIFECDELQHFTAYRALTLRHYPADWPLGFDRVRYLNLCRKHAAAALDKGAASYRKSKFEFPFVNGRAAQRAFYDARRDLLAVSHGLRPVVRISQFDLDFNTTITLAEQIKDQLPAFLTPLTKPPAKGAPHA